MTLSGEPVWPVDTQIPEELWNRPSELPQRIADALRGVQRAMSSRAPAAGEDALRELIAVTATDDVHRWLWAAAHQEFAELMSQDPGRVKDVIASYEAALTYYSPAVCPHEHAKAQHNMGTTLLERVAENREENVERAITALSRAVAGRSEAGDKYGRGRSLNNLGNAYMKRVRGDKAENQAEAIAHYVAAIAEHGQDDHPHDFAMDHTNLALAYREHVGGDRIRNLDLATVSFASALIVHHRQADPVRYHRLVNSLDSTVQERLELTPPEYRVAVLTALHPAVRELAEGPDWLRVPELVDAAAGEEPFEDPRWSPDPELFAEYGFELAQSVSLPQLVLQLVPSSPVQADHRYRAQLLRGALHRPDVVEPSFRADLFAELAIALQHVPGRLADVIKAWTEAAELLPRPEADDRWARTQLGLSGAVAGLVDGDRGENMERALGHARAATSACTRESDPEMWAMCMLHLGRILRDRVFGDEYENAVEAITALEAALTVWTRDSNPMAWAMVRNTTGTVYRQASFAVPLPHRLAIESFEDALTVITAENMPHEWAGVETNRGLALLEASDIEGGIAALSSALRVRSRESAPKEWAELQHNLGGAHRMLRDGTRADNLRRALDHYTAALEVHRLDTLPFDHRRTIGAVGMIHAELGEWEVAHRAFASARRAGELLLRQVSTGAHGFDDVVKQGHEANELDAYVLTQLGLTEEAVEALERGRAYDLIESLSIRATDPARITDDDLRARYVDARDALLAARRAVDDVPWRQLAGDVMAKLKTDEPNAVEQAQAMHAATNRFNAVVEEIRSTEHTPDLFDTTFGLADVPDGTVYLLSTPWGGLALAVHTDQSVKRASALPLPGLTDNLLSDLAYQRLTDGSDRVVGGYASAQEGIGLNWVFHQWPGDNLAARMRALCDHCNAIGPSSALADAIRVLLDIADLTTLLYTPVSDLTRDDLNRVSGALNHRYLKAELERCLPALAEVALTPVANWVRCLNTRSTTLIPCGILPAFPMATVLVGGSGAHNPSAGTFADTVPTTVAPTARTSVTVNKQEPTRDGVFTLGDPRPTHQALRWGEAEAKTVAALGGDPGRARVHEAATLEWLIESMSRGSFVSAACHGRFDGRDVLKSGLVLAGGQRFTLADAFALTKDIEGLPLLVLSACQAAVVNLRGASSEVRSLPTGMLQAGVRAVVAPLWAVDDQATYLLMTRFAQEHLPEMEHPGAALARAQAWLRAVTYEDLTRWQPDLEDSDVERYSAENARRFVAATSAQHRGTDTPYAHPIYWAGFQVYGVVAHAPDRQSRREGSCRPQQMAPGTVSSLPRERWTPAAVRESL